MVPLKDISGVTHFAAYEYSLLGWKRTTVYRVKGRSENNLIYYFESVRGNAEHKRGANYLFLETFRPFAIDGGKKRQ